MVTIKVKNRRSALPEDLTDAGTRKRLVADAERAVRQDEITWVRRVMRRQRAAEQPG